MEYDVLSVAVSTLKRMDEAKAEEQDAAYNCLNLVNAILESSPDPTISTKVRFERHFYFTNYYGINRPLKVPICCYGC